MSRMQNFIKQTRNLRKEKGVPEKTEVAVRINVESTVWESLTKNFDIINRLARVSELQECEKAREIADLSHIGVFDIEILYEAKIDIPAERERLTKDLAKYEKGLTAAERQLGNESFMAKAPAHIVEGLRKQAAETRTIHDKTKAALEALPLN